MRKFPASDLVHEAAAGEVEANPLSAKREAARFAGNHAADSRVVEVGRRAHRAGEETEVMSDRTRWISAGGEQ